MFRWLTVTLPAVMLIVSGSFSDAAAGIPSRLRRIDILPRSDHTRLIFQLDNETAHAVTELTGNRMKVLFPNADAPAFRNLRSYADKHVKGISVARRGEQLQVIIGMSAPGEGFRVINSSARALTLDIGPRFGSANSTPVLAGRESIWNGAGRFVKEYDPPSRSELPFVPTDKKALLPLLSDEEARLFLAGEASIYKGESSDAVSVFTSFMEKGSGIGALATYRCGQAYYGMLEYDKALRLFRSAEAMWPQFLDISPDVKFAYADCLARGGDLPAGRKLLAGLIASKAEKKFAPVLLVRLADILARQQRDLESASIYRNVVTLFPDNKAALHAALKLADRRFLRIDSLGYPELRDEYIRIGKGSSDFGVREEALFKAALLDSLFGTGAEALRAVSEYEKKYPRGIFTSLAHSMHVDLMPVVYRELVASGDAEGLVKVMEEHADYLGKCMAEPVFFSDLDSSYVKLGKKQDENRLFDRLVRREWAVQHAPYLYGKILDNSVALADWKLAETTGREFIRKFPSLNQTRRVRELMGDIGYRTGDLKSVRVDLAFLMAPKTRPENPESYYFLGKSLEAAGEVRQAGKAMELFLAAVRSSGVPSPLVADAHFVAGTSYLADRKSQKALASFSAGLGQSAPDGRDRFLYRIGEVRKNEGRGDEAKKNWEKIVKEGSDPVWQKLAAQQLADVAWKERTGVGI